MARASIDALPSDLQKLPQALNVRESEKGRLITLRLDVSTLAIGITFSQGFKMGSKLMQYFFSK
jgi:hypothetical protein